MRLLDKRLTLRFKTKKIFVKYILFLFFARIVVVLY